MIKRKSGDIAVSLRDRVLRGEWTGTGVMPNERAFRWNTVLRATRSAVPSRV